MSGRVLDFKSYIGGADNVIVEEMFRSTQKAYTYDYGFDVTGYTFEADYQTIVVDTVTYDRVTSEPNFTESTVVGYFANAEISNSFVNTGSAASGLVTLTIPSDRYTGNVIPDARSNVAITVVKFGWTDTTTTPNITDSHRYAIIERFEPDSTIGNPRESAGFTSIT
ncbi:hypothetical protein N9245_00330 [bacterium]|nr:hypothetical protein [bacterium]